MAKIPVTVYHIGPGCVQCNQTKRQMDKLGIIYDEVDLRDPANADKLAEFQALGHSTAPIVTTDTKIWSGFRLTKIKSLADFIFSQENKKNA